MDSQRKSDMKPMSVELFRDPTPDGLINLRYVTHFVSIASEYTDFDEPEFKRFLRSLLFIGKKLVAVWQHLDRYKAIQAELVDRADTSESDDASDVIHLSYAQDLYIEFDEFLVQVKSTLDYLAKLPRDIIGPAGWPNLRTFGNKGQDVVKALNNNVPKRYSKSTDVLLRVMRKYGPWIELAVASRDRINHGKDGGVEFEVFLVARMERNGEMVTVVPMLTDAQSIQDFMVISWHNVLTLCEQFTIGALSMRLKEGIGFLHQMREPGSVNSPILVAPDDVVNEVMSVLAAIDPSSVAKDPD